MLNCTLSGSVVPHRWLMWERAVGRLRSKGASTGKPRKAGWWTTWYNTLWLLKSSVNLINQPTNSSPGYSLLQKRRIEEVNRKKRQQQTMVVVNTDGRPNSGHKKKDERKALLRTGQGSKPTTPENFHGGFSCNLGWDLFSCYFESNCVINVHECMVQVLICGFLYSQTEFVAQLWIN